jgi:hypothetical protein
MYLTCMSKSKASSSAAKISSPVKLKLETLIELAEKRKTQNMQNKSSLLMIPTAQESDRKATHLDPVLKPLYNDLN